MIRTGALPLLDLRTQLESFLHLFDVKFEEFVRVGLRLLLIWGLAWAGWQLVKIAGKRIVAAADDGDDTRLSYHEKRAQTIAQLLRSVGRVVLLILAGILTLAQFMNITPLLAGASIIGLAVSFGSQSLVKDFIGGFFILMENQFAVGDVIEVAGKSGTVERMTLRMVMLRDLQGTVHVVPNGQITTVSNQTRGWSRAVVDVGIGYDSDVDQALEVLRDEARRFGVDPAWKARLDAPPEVVGVQALGDNAVAIRVLLRTPPGMQWEVGREFRRRVKVRLDREGIEIPFPQRTVHVRHHGAPPADQATRDAITDAATGGA